MSEIGESSPVADASTRIAWFNLRRMGISSESAGLDKVESYVKRGIHGFDGIYKKGNKYFILEAKIL